MKFVNKNINKPTRNYKTSGAIYTRTIVPLYGAVYVLVGIRNERSKTNGRGHGPCDTRGASIHGCHVIDDGRGFRTAICCKPYAAAGTRASGVRGGVAAHLGPSPPRISGRRRAAPLVGGPLLFNGQDGRRGGRPTITRNTGDAATREKKNQSRRSVPTT